MGVWRGDFGTERSQGEGRKGMGWAVSPLGMGKARGSTGGCSGHHCGHSAAQKCRTAPGEEPGEQLLNRDMRQELQEVEEMRIKPPEQHPAMARAEPPDPGAGWGWLGGMGWDG